MGKTIAEKIIEQHLLSGEMKTGEEIGLRIDQTLTQDATGTMAYLEFESMGVDQVRTERSVAYIDHNTLQSGFENADDHRYIQSVAAKHGIWFSRPGNGICHQLQYERIGKPGKTLIGSDSHTPTGGGLGMLAMGAGGMDVAVAMGGGAYYIPMPRMIRVNLKNRLGDNVSAKDVILEVLRQLSVKGGVGAIVEYGGEGIQSLSVPERCTITNMGAELGATTSIFPSDEETRKFLKAQNREEDWIPLSSDEDAVYAEEYTIDLSELKPLAACPHSPDNVKPVEELKKIKVDQIAIGSCTNSSYADMLKVARMLKGKKIADGVSLGISPGSRQVLSMLAECGALTDMIDAGARILECTCGPCIGMGFSPNSGGVSLRTFNRNFLGRSGTKDGQVYLVSPETAAASALTGYITDPTTLESVGKVEIPEQFRINDSGFIPPLPPEEAKDADNKMIVFSVFCCVIMAALMFVVGGFFPGIYNTSEEIKGLATQFIAVSAIIMPFCAFSHASYFTLRSGGKTVVTFLFDSVFTWVIVVPAAYLLAHFTGLGIVSIYFLVQGTEMIKVIIGYYMVKSNVWVVQMV